METLIFAILGTLFTFLMTVFGSSSVFLIKKDVRQSTQQVFLGFAAGVMIAASVWSLLLPALEAAEQLGIIPWVPVAGGFVIGGFFLWIMDISLKKIQPVKMSHGSFLLFSAITMHNIPEGMAVGLAFAASKGAEVNSMLYVSAIGLALGIGIQNFPEGAAIALPLQKEGMSKGKAFLYGSLTGVVEPVFGVLVTLAAEFARSLMPWLLSFAAGAMVYVVADELIPRASENDKKGAGTLGVMIGFLIMMTLDVALG